MGFPATDRLSPRSVLSPWI
uniref:Uncharacterized protein n=1 Tax=Anguilla anguilla TaxID=7936 RepID=A0A0E9UT84_ANGAN